MSEKLQLIVTCITTGISVVAVLFSIIKGIINSKNNKSTANVIKLNEIISEIPRTVTEAEDIFGSGNGLAKLNYVLNKIQIKCLQNQVTFNETEIRDKVEEILETPEKKPTEQTRALSYTQAQRENI